MATMQEALANALKVKSAQDELPEGLRSLRDNLRTKYGERIAAFTDLQVVQTYRDWTMSSEAGDDNTLVEWLTEKYGETAPKSVAQAEAEVTQPEPAVAEDGRLSLVEIQRRVDAGEISSHDAIALLEEHGHLDEDGEGTESDADDDESDEKGEELSADYEANDEEEPMEGDRYAEPDSVDGGAVSGGMTASELEAAYQDGLITLHERNNMMAELGISEEELSTVIIETREARREAHALGESESESAPVIEAPKELAANPEYLEWLKAKEAAAAPPVLVNPMEELTSRQTLSVIADHLKARRQEELFAILGDILGRVYKMEAVTESDVMVALADNVRLVDFVVAMTREVGIEPAMPKTHIIPVNVEESSVIFKPRKTRYNMTDLESAMVNAIGRMRAHMRGADKVESLEKRVKELETELRKANLETKAAKEVVDQVSASLAIEKQKPAPVPVAMKGKTGSVVLSWVAERVKKNKKTGVRTVTGETRYYLTTVPGASLNAKGEMPTKQWLRTTNVDEAYLFDNAAEATRVVERIVKNAKHLTPESGVTEKVMQKVARLSVAAVPV